MPEFKRTVNKKYFNLLLQLHELNLLTLGQKLTPPLTRAGVCKITTIGDSYKPEGYIQQIADVLRVPDVNIFPWSPVESLKYIQNDARSAEINTKEVAAGNDG